MIVGFIVGILGTAVGAGGGFLISPFLLMAYGLPPSEVVGTSLVVILFNVLSGTGAFIRQRMIDFRSGWRFALAALPGAIIGIGLLSSISNRMFQILLGVLLFFIAFLIVFRTTYKGFKNGGDGRGSSDSLQNGDVRDLSPIRGGSSSSPGILLMRTFVEIRSKDGRNFRFSYHPLAGIFIAILVGPISTLFGLGGGVLFVPAAVFFLSFPPHVATATSYFLQIFTVGIGVIGHAVLGNVKLDLALPLVAGVIMGAPVGARLASRMRGQVILYLLAGILCLLALRLTVGFQPR